LSSERVFNSAIIYRHPPCFAINRSGKIEWNIRTAAVKISRPTAVFMEHDYAMSLKHFAKCVKDKIKDGHIQPIVIVALGDSVTMGCMKDCNDYENVYHARLKKLLERQYPQAVFSVINAGIGGDSAKGGLRRLQRDVIRYLPDLVIIGFALNDSCCGIENLDEYRKAMSTMVNRIRKRTKADVVLLTPNFMNFADSPNVPDEYRKCKLADVFAKIQKGGILKRYAETIREVADEYGANVADTYAAWEELSAAGVDTDALLVNGLNHPVAAAHAIPAELVMRCIVDDFNVTAVRNIIKKYGKTTSHMKKQRIIKKSVAD